jgi:hypothetical protein
MGSFISWIKENMGEDENQGSAQEEKAPPSLSGTTSRNRSTTIAMATNYLFVRY